MFETCFAQFQTCFAPLKHVSNMLRTAETCLKHVSDVRNMFQTKRNIFQTCFAVQNMFQPPRTMFQLGETCLNFRETCFSCANHVSDSHLELLPASYYKPSRAITSKLLQAISSYYQRAITSHPELLPASYYKPSRA